MARPGRLEGYRLEGGPGAAGMIAGDGDALDLVELVHRAYAAAGDPSLWPWLLEWLQQSLGSTSSILARYDVERRDGAILHSVGVAPELLETYWHGSGAWAGALARHRQPGAVWAGRQAIPLRKLPVSEIYHGWLRPHGLAHSLPHGLPHSLHGLLLNDGAVVWYVALLRAPRLGAFRQADVAALQRFLPQLQRALQLHKRFEALRSMRDMTLELLDRLAVGTILLERGGHVLAVNQPARGLLERADGMSLGRDGLMAASHEETVRLHDLIALAGRTTTGQKTAIGDALTLTRPSGRRPLSVLVAPLRPTPGLFVREDDLAALFVVDVDAQAEPDASRLQQLFGLTRSEAGIAAHLAQGLRLEEAAASLGISLHTARTHLKRALSKTDARRQAELVRLVLVSTGQIRAR